MTDTYHRIAMENYPFDRGQLTNEALRSYFDRCFDDALSLSGHYPAYGCVDCALRSTGVLYLGEKPKACQDCGSDRVFELGTFQGRAPVYGASFTSAVQVLLRRCFSINLRPTPHNTKTHDLEASPRIAIEVKGSARQIKLRNGQSIRLSRPGLLRSDTEIRPRLMAEITNASTHLGCSML